MDSSSLKLFQNPGQSGQPFRDKADSHSVLKRTPILDQPDPPFRDIDPWGQYLPVWHFDPLNIKSFLLDFAD